MIIFWVILSVWVTGSLAIGIWASVRLHRDEYWMAHGDEGWTKFDCAKGFVEHFHTWPGETLVAVLSAVFWPVALLVGALAYLAVGLVWASAQPFAAIGRSASKTKAKPVTYLKKM